MNMHFLRRLQRHIVAFAIGSAAVFSASAQTNSAPPFETIFKLLQQNIAGMSSEELNAAAVRGLLSELEDHVSLVTNTAPETIAASNLITKTTTFDGSYVYLRVAQVEAGLSEKVAEHYKQAASTNKIKGIILDLRFAEGDSYEAAAKTADLFVSTAQPLINWGEGSMSSSTKAMLISVPCAILVNSRTRGAAEALGAVLRETRVGLLIGGTTAGQASVFKEHPLQNGQALRIASSPVKVGRTKVLGVNGLTPDIQLDISLEHERAYLKDPYQVMSRPVDQVSLTLSTNVSSAVESRPRINEAELVRRKRQGLSTEDEFINPVTGITDADELRVIRDPSLARALDLLKGLALIQANRGF